PSSLIYTLSLHDALPIFPVKQRQFVLDPACGTGILLSAAVLRLARGSAAAASDLIGASVCGADLSIQALKGALLSLATITGDHVDRKSTRLNSSHLGISY